MTNLEKIQSLDSKDFANLLDSTQIACDYCLYNTAEYNYRCTIALCKQGITEWLESECEL